MNSSIHSHRQSVAAQSGFTLVELMIAVLIGLFLVGGLLTLTSAMKRTGGIQNNLTQLHDSERTAMTLLNDVIQSAGYFPNPLVNTASSEFLVVSPFTAIGQTVIGADGGTASAPLDKVSVRYVTAGTVNGDQTINCLGASSPTATAWTNTFLVDGTGNFQCILTTGTAAPAAAVTLVSGVKYMSVVYGVQTNTGSGTSSADTYLTATQINATPSYWANVISVQIQLFFVNPLYGTLPGQSTATTIPQTISVTRTIAIMNKVGVNT